MRALGLCSYPTEAAATRFRLEQFVGPLATHGIELTVSPFLNSLQFKALYKHGGVFGKVLGLVRPVLKRVSELFAVGKYDLILVQREAMIFGPAIFEWLYQKLGRVPMVLDLDDATYVRYVSPTYGRIGSFFKFFGKTDNLIKRSELVVSGNRYIAEYVESKGAESVVIPTVVDTDAFCPIEKSNEIPVIGWIGTHSTYPFLQSIFPVLERLASKHRFVLKIVGAEVETIKIDGVQIENHEWAMEREIADFQSLDIGLYPITISGAANEQWLLGKSGFKAIQYMAVGVPFVMSPVGVCGEIGVAGITHFNAETLENWHDSLDRLLSDRTLRSEMGKAARLHSLEHYGREKHASALAKALRSVT